MNDFVMQSSAAAHVQPADAVPQHLQDAYAALRQLQVFDGISNEDLYSTMAGGGIQWVVLERDVFVADPMRVAEGVAPVCFVAQGQISVALFDQADLVGRKAEQERRAQMSAQEREKLSLLAPPPLARIAKKNLAVFMTGDLFNTSALAMGGAPVAFYTVEPTSVAIVEHAALADLAVRYPFFEARFRRAIQSSRARLRNVTGVKQEVLDFFVRQGISVSGQMVRVRQLDRCIDCKLCEQACEERYGAKRLTLGGYQLGMLDFVFSCRTCTDQRCIDPCEYDSIKYDAQRGEVVINEASCTGCTLCAQSCPYHAIEMVDIEDPSNPTYRARFKKRLHKRGALAYGSGAPRLARPRRIANKCDHCIAYRDQACVSACPTGALIEISAYELFRERSPKHQAVAQAGYDQELKPERKELLPTEPFTQGVGVRGAGSAKVRRGRIWPMLWWVVGIGAWLAATAEILLRIYWPEQSLYFSDLLAGGYSEQIARDKVGFRVGNELAINCGYLGTALMGVATIYPMLRRFKLFRAVASNTMWFDFHLMAGTVGPMFILLHSALKLDNWVSVAFWSMVIVVISGFIGRYLYTQVPDLLNGRELEELEHQRVFTQLKRSHPFAIAEAETILGAHRHKAEHIARNAGMLRTLWWLLIEDMMLLRPFRNWARKRRLRKTGAPRKIVRELTRRTGRMLLMNRRRVLVPRAQLLLHSWKKVHVPFTIILTVVSAIHIWVAFEFSM